MINFNIKKLAASLLLILISCVPIFSQKADLKKIAVSYKQLPLIILDESIKSYSSVLNMDISLENTDNDKLNNQYLKLYGFEKVKNQGDILVTANFDEFQINKELVTDDVYNVNQGKNMKGFYYKISCKYPVTISVKSKEGKLLFEQAINHDEKLLNFNFGKWTYSNGELDTKLNAEKNELITKLKSNIDKKALSEIKSCLSSNFSYLPVTKKIKIASGKGKKMDYSDLETACQHMEKAFNTISTDGSQADVNVELEKAIEIWENALKESSDNKKTRINKPITTMLNYNIAIAYWWMLDFIKAKEYAQKALELDKSNEKSSSEELISEAIDNINDYEKRLKIHGKI